MMSKSYTGYIEGQDISSVPPNYMSFPAQNVLIHKGIAFTRPGIVNDGTPYTTDGKIIGEYVFKSSLSGEQPVRWTQNGKMQLKYNGKWLTIFQSSNSAALRVRADVWTDSNGAIIKNRLFWVDGTDQIYEWNGAVAVIASASGTSVTVNGTTNLTNLSQFGFDDGSSPNLTIASVAANIITISMSDSELANGQAVVFQATTAGNLVNGTTYYLILLSDSTFSVATTLANAKAGTAIALSGSEAGYFADALAQPVSIVRFVAGVAQPVNTYTNTDNASTLVMTLSSAVTGSPAAGDLLIGGIIQHGEVLTGIIKDEIYTYQNRLVLAALTGLRVYFSDVVSKLDYNFPAAANETATTPFFINLPNFFTAMRARYNATTQLSSLYISNIDSWTKVNALLEQDTYGEFVTTQSIAESERLGALPFACDSYKQDLIFFAQDRTFQQITTIDVTGKDSFTLLSDEVEGLLQRLNVTECRVYYLTRYVYLFCPASGITVMLDTVEGHWQTPQTLPVAYMSVIGGIQYGHSNVRAETFYLFKGRNDLGTGIVSIFAIGYYQGYQRISRSTHVTQDFFLKAHSKFGLSGRMTEPTVATVQQYMEHDGARDDPSFIIDGSQINFYEKSFDASWGSTPWGSASWSGADAPAYSPTDNIDTQVDKFIVWKTVQTVAWFEWRVIITVQPAEGETDQEFHLIGFYIDDIISDRKIPASLFIPTNYD
jgi:hypothetical protein